MRPKTGEHPKYSDYYINLLSQENVLTALNETKKAGLNFIKSIPNELAGFAYAEGKWTTKQVLIHCIDTERIVSTRALNFARADIQKPLSFDENLYASKSKAETRTLTSIEEEFEVVRNSTILLFKSFSPEILLSIGNTQSGPTTINAVGFFICGHTQHHLNIIQERYLKNNFTIKN